MTDPRQDGPRLNPVDFDPFGSAPARTSLPLTAPQQEVWAAAQMGPEASAAYNQCFPIRLHGHLSIDSLRTAFARAAERHDALRAAFAASGDEQVIAPSVVVPLTLVDVSSESDEGRRAAIDALLAREVRQPFELTTAPLLRVHVVRETETSHVLVVTAHHLICDGWSSGILLQDVGAFYTADRHGIPARLPAVLPYGDFVRDTIREHEGGASDAYWVRQFAAGAPALELPTDRPHGPSRSFNGSNARLTIEPSLYRDIKSLGARHGCTLYVTLLAAWEALLARLTRQSDLVVGIPVAGQASLENGHVIGHAVHMLPLRAAVDLSSSFADHLAVARRGLVEAHEHRTITFGRLLRQLNLARDSSHTPLIAAVFNVDRPTEPPAFDGLTLERLAAPRSAYSFEIGLDIADTGADLVIECNFNADLFDAATIDRWLACYRTLLASAAARPTDPVARLAIMPSEEIESLRRLGAARGSADAPFVHEAFERIAAASPARIAVSSEGESISYGDLNGRANRLARSLVARGVTRGSLVGICLERSPELLVSILAVLKAGAAYVPLDPDCPADRVAAMLDDAGLRVVVGSEATEHLFEHRRTSLVRVDADASEIARQAAGDLGTAVSPDDTAYVIFTSGSTGKPKGVAVTHRNVARLFGATEPWFQFGPDDVWTLFHSVAFDFSVWEIWGALRYGGRLVVVPHTISRSPDAFHELLKREGVTVLNQTPSAFRQLIEADRTAPAPLTALRFVVFGGEALDLQSLRGWIERYGDDRPALINMYGITETTVHVTYRRVREADLALGGRSPIGVPIPDLDLHLLDPDASDLVPVGVAGEICVGGAGVAAGYLNRAELTAARFVRHPFASGDGRLYRSGDLARRRPDGDLEYLGRIDHQVKVRGFRIELGEIEAALVRHPSVREAAVVLSPTAGGDARLAAYVVPAGEKDVDVAELLEHLRAWLPDYMVPGAFMTLDALPINGNGKLDRRRLPAVDTRTSHAADRVDPRTPTESALAEIWRDVLELSYVGMNDSFFDLGGHSMLAVKIVSRARERFGIELPVAALFRAPTVAKLAETIDGVKVTASAPIQPSAGREVFEL